MLARRGGFMPQRPSQCCEPGLAPIFRAFVPALLNADVSRLVGAGKPLLAPGMLVYTGEEP
ncbi:MAG: hypothetical protein IPL27_04510 [Lewinellaceae bacterium]|nr:hypothetical protein [Lewinellaceae bacterium]